MRLCNKISPSFLLLLMLVPSCWMPTESGNLPRIRSRRSLQQNNDTSLDCNLTFFQSHFLVDLVGFPRELEAVDDAELSFRFLQAYNEVKDGPCLNVTSAGVVNSKFASLDATTMNGTIERDFSVLMVASGVCRGCQGTNLLRIRSDTRRELQSDSIQNVDSKHTEDAATNSMRAARRTQQNTTVECTGCLPPTRNRFLLRWRTDFQSTSGSISSIFDINELFFPDTCDPANFTNFETNVVAIVNTTSTNLSETDLNDLSSIFRESYKAVNELNSDLCDPYFRRMSGVSATVENDTSQYANLMDLADPSLVYVRFMVQGFCQDCGEFASLFGGLSSISSRRDLQEEGTLCLCPSNVDQEGPTELQFRNEFALATRDLQFVNSVAEVIEVSSTECDDEIVEFNQTILLEVNNGCENGTMLEADINVIESAAVTAYNELAESFCDPHLRMLDSAKLTQRSSNSTAQTVTLELTAYGRCRGCDPNDVSIYSSHAETSSLVSRALLSLSDDTKEDASVRRGRRLETCYCDIDATQNRAPTEVEFIDFFSGYIHSQASLSCVASVVECGFGSPFQTAIVASFANETVAEAYAASMEAAFLRSISASYQNRVDLCNPQFRVFDSVDSTIGVPFQPRDFYLSVDRRRLLRQTNRKLQTNTPTGPTTAGPTPGPTFAPSYSPSSSPSAQPTSEPSASPSMSPSFIDTDTYVLFYFDGVCDGCQGKPAILPTSSLQVPLGGEPSDLSQCYCPVDVEQVTGPFSPDSLEQVFQDELAVENVTLYVRNVYEVDVVECEGDITDFEGNLYVSFSFNGTLAQGELRRLTDLVEATYQSLSMQYCDPQRLRLSSLNFERGTPVDNNSTCSEFQFSFGFSGLCQGCENGTSLLEETAEERRELSDNILNSFYDATEPPRRLRFEGDNTCFCDQSTIASRPPTLLEFEQALAGALALDSSLAKVCSVSVPSQDVETPAPTASPTEAVCNVTLPDSLTARVLVTVNLEQDQQLSDAEQSQIGDTILTTYNNIINLRFDPCDLEYRLISNVTVDGTELYGVSESILFIVKVDCQGCMPDSDLFSSMVIGRSSFERVFSVNVNAGFSNGFLGSVREVDLRSCPSDISSFSTVIRMEYTQLSCEDGLNFTGSEPQLRSVEAAFVSTYNRLALGYCDPFYRILETAEIVRVGENTADGNLPTEIMINGTCRGCNVDELDIYAIPNTMTGVRMLVEGSIFVADSDRRQLQDLETCFCDAQPIAERAPFEAEFVTEYREAVEALQLECIEGVSQCDFGTRFTTGIVVQFQSDELLESGNVTSTIEETFQRIINDLYEVDDDTCNPEFRIVESVQATIGVNLTAKANATAQTDGRLLQAATEFPTASPIATASPISAPETNATAPVSSPVVFLPTDSPTISFGIGSIPVLLYVSGVCNGCANDLSFSNQVLANRRRLLEPRALQDSMFNSTSNCFCPLESTRQVGSVAADVVTETFQSALDEQVNLTVDEIDEITVVECIDEPRDFETTFTFTFAALEGVTDREIEELTTLIATTYNDLNEAYCDSFLRVIDGLFVADFTGDESKTGENGCFNLELEFDAFGTCRGCENNIDIFDEATEIGRRRELSEFLVDVSGASRGTRRGLQEFDVCFCEGETIASRAPTFEEFSMVFQPKLEALALPNICGFFEVVELANQNRICDVESIGEEFEASIEISMVVEADFDGMFFTDLEMVFFETFNSQIDSSLDTCDPDYTQLFFTAVDTVPVRRRGLADGDDARALQSFIFLTATFTYFGYCIVGPCGGVISVVIGDITSELERRVSSVAAASTSEDIFDSFETDPPFIDVGTGFPGFSDSPAGVPIETFEPFYEESGFPVISSEPFYGYSDSPFGVFTEEPFSETDSGFPVAFQSEFPGGVFTEEPFFGTPESGVPGGVFTEEPFFGTPESGVPGGVFTEEPFFGPTPDTPEPGFGPTPETPEPGFVPTPETPEPGFVPTPETPVPGTLPTPETEEPGTGEGTSPPGPQPTPVPFTPETPEPFMGPPTEPPENGPAPETPEPFMEPPTETPEPFMGPPPTFEPMPPPTFPPLPPPTFPPLPPPTFEPEPDPTPEPLPPPTFEPEPDPTPEPLPPPTFEPEPDPTPAPFTPEPVPETPEPVPETPEPVPETPEPEPFPETPEPF